jgi:hypothetical protein
VWGTNPYSVFPPRGAWKIPKSKTSIVHHKLKPNKVVGGHIDSETNHSSSIFAVVARLTKRIRLGAMHPMRSKEPLSLHWNCSASQPHRRFAVKYSLGAWGFQLPASVLSLESRRLYKVTEAQQVGSSWTGRK